MSIFFEEWRLPRDLIHDLHWSGREVAKTKEAMMLKHSKLTGIFLVISMMVVALTSSALMGCQKKGEVKIGAIFPLTGTAAEYGKRAMQGTQLAVDEINEAGGIKGRKLKLYVEDSQGDPKQAATIMNKFVSEGGYPIVLCLTTGETSVAAPIAQENEIVLLTGTVAPGVTEKGDYIFRNASNLILNANAMMDVCLDSLGLKRLAIIGLEIDAHLAVEKYVKKEFVARSGEVVAIENGQRGQTDFRTQLTKIKAKNPEALYILGYSEIATMMKQARELGIKAQFFGDPSMESPEVTRVAGSAAEGTIYTRSAFDPEDTSSVIRNFQKKYKERYGELGDEYAAEFFDSIHLIAIAIGKYGASSDDIRKGLMAIKDYPGVSGRTTFLPNRDVAKPVVLKMIKEGKFVPYSPELL
jgi:branched-chain amino acid transport system substrate-binding protein